MCVCVCDPGLNLPSSRTAGTLSLRHPPLFQPLLIFPSFLPLISPPPSVGALISTCCRRVSFSRVKTRKQRTFSLLPISASVSVSFFSPLHSYHFPGTSVIIKALSAGLFHAARPGHTLLRSHASIALSVSHLMKLLRLNARSLVKARLYFLHSQGRKKNWVNFMAAHHVICQSLSWNVTLAPHCEL